MQSTLSGLRSLCAMPCLCRCFKAPAKSFTILLASASVKDLAGALKHLHKQGIAH